AEKLNRDHPFVREGQPTTMFYSARVMAQPASTIYAQELRAGATSRKVYSDAKPGFLRDVDQKAGRGLFVRTPSRTDNQLLVVNLVNGETGTLYPTDGKQVHIDDASFSADGQRALVATDGGGEQALVLALDIASGKELARYVETHPAYASISTLRVARTG